MSHNIPYYLGGIKRAFCDGFVSVEYIIKAIQKPKTSISIILGEIQDAAERGDKDKKNFWKAKLPFFTPSVIIPLGSSRRYENIQDFTKLAQLDFDGFDSSEEAKEFKEYLFNEDDLKDSIVMTFLSPSKLGVKALIRIPKAKDTDDFKAYFRAIQNHFELITPTFDSAPLNAVLPLFIAEDEEILYRDFADAVEYSEQFFREEVEFFNEKNPVTHTPTSQDKYYTTTVRIFTEKINAIASSEGHTTLRDCCLWLGSKVGAEYISEYEAISLAENMIRGNGYLTRGGKSGVDNYTKTAKWAIGKGRARPLFYEFF